MDEDNYKKDREICKNCYNINRKRYNNNTSSRNDNDKKKIKVVNSVNNKNNIYNRTLILGFSNCGKTYLMNHNLLQKQEPIFIIKKSLNQYLNIKAETSDKIHPLEHYENKTVVFDDMLLSIQESKFNLFFLPEVVTIILIYTTYLKVIFISQKILFVIILIYSFYLNKL